MIKLSSNITVRDAYTAIAQDCVSQVIAFEQGTRDRNPEALHKMRVGVRRLRSVINLFKHAIVFERVNGLIDDLRWLQEALGKARDWDVFIQKTAQMRHCLPKEEEADFKRFQKACREAQIVAYNVLHDDIETERYATILKCVQELIATEQHGDQTGTNEKWRDKPAREFADYTLRRRRKKVLVLGKQIATLTEPELHELRKQIKKLRYGMEFFASFYPKKQVSKTIGRLVDLQDMIGHLVDVSASQQILKHLNRQDGKTNRVFIKGTGLVIGWQAALSCNCMTEITKIWKKYHNLATA